MLIVQSLMLHGEQKFRAARIETRILAIVHQHLRGFRDAGRLMYFKSAECSHRLSWNSLPKLLGALAVAQVEQASACFLLLFARAKGTQTKVCATTDASYSVPFFNCNAFHTRSGVRGSVLMRTPVAWCSAFAMHGEMGFTAPSPPPFAP